MRPNVGQFFESLTDSDRFESSDVSAAKRGLRLVSRVFENNVVELRNEIPENAKPVRFECPKSQ